MPETDENPIGYGALIRQNRNFRWLWLGQVVSMLGDWFNMIGAAALMGKLTGSDFAVGILLMLRMLAPFAVAPLAGICADRFNRKHILILTDIVRAVTVFGLLFVRDAGDIWLLYTLTALLLAVSGFFDPARNAILPDITTPQELGTANTIGAITWSAMLALGAAIGGVTAGLFGIHTAFFVDGLTFLVSAGFLLCLRLPKHPAHAEKSISASKPKALRYLFRHPDILFIALHKTAIAFMLSAGFQVAQVKISKDYFVIGDGGALGLGVMYCVNGVGCASGPILARLLTGDRDKPLRVSIVFGYLLGAMGVAIIAPLFNFSTVLLGELVRSMGGATVWVFSTQLLLQNVPHKISGRVFATELACYMLMGGIGTIVLGALLDVFPNTSLVLSGMSGLPLIPALLWWLWLAARRSAEKTEGKSR